MSIDSSLFPLVVSRLVGDKLTDDDVRSYIADFDRVLARGPAFVHVVDTRRMSTAANAVQRKMFGDWLRDETAVRLARTYKGCDALIVSSALMRGAITAALWLSPPSSPTKSFGTTREALSFLEEHAAAKGVHLSPAARRWLEAH